MISSAYCQKMALYSEWMNGSLYKSCAKLSDSERKQDQGLFFRSIHGTLNHLLVGDVAWLSRFTSEEPNLPPLGEELHESFDELSNAREQWDKRLSDWAASVDESWLAAPFSFTSNVDGETRTSPAWVLVTHMYNHGTHHRGQLTAALSQLGCDYGSTDLPFTPDL